MRKIKTLMKIIFGWLILAPLSLLIPKDKNLIIFIGSYSKFFRDNSKYLFLYILRSQKFKTYFLTADKEVFHTLKRNNINSLFYPSFFSILKILRTKIIIVDDHMWFKRCKFYLTKGSQLVQLWHGSGIKYVELMNRDEGYYKNKKTKIIKILSGRFPKYDLITSPSEFFSENFYKKSFRFKKIRITGYARNDIFLKKDIENNYFIFSDKKLYDYLSEIRNKKHKVIIYLPTFRDKLNNKIDKSVIDYDRLDKFLIENKMIFIIKYHSTISFKSKKQYKNIIFFDSQKDIYPILKLSDILITDYSSIFFDYLLLNKPILFYTYDIEEYVKNDRGFYLDFNKITPGAKVNNFNELLREIKTILIYNKDNYSNKRKEIQEIAFKYNDENSCKRILMEIENLIN